ncbi:MAG: metallophosphoesterase [Planctomycetes bacterium]|nr:metallophosphoesterase [Planctomycetota bacterium]
MSSTWVVGDIHGCAEELAELIQKLMLSGEDRFLSVGDLYHRGPDPLGVAQQLTALPGFELVLGNHERAMWRRAGLVGQAADGSDARPLPEEDSAWDESVLLGDGRTSMKRVGLADVRSLLAPLVQQPYFRRGEGPEDQAWIAVHAGVVPGLPVEQSSPDLLCSLRRMHELPGAPYWYETYAGPELVLFGHTPSRFPRACRAQGRLVALGLDTGCVYGGSLTAYRIEDGELAAVDAKRDYVND